MARTEREESPKERSPSRARSLRLLCIAAMSILLTFSGRVALPDDSPRTSSPRAGSGAEAKIARPRYPADVVVSPDGRWLAVANEESGTVSLVDARAGSVVDEIALVPGGRPARLALAKKGESFTVAVAESFAHRVTLLEAAQDRWVHRGSLVVGRLPADVVFWRGGEGLLVACRGSSEVWDVDARAMRLVRRIRAVEGARRLLVVDDVGARRDGSVRALVAGRTDLGVIDLESGAVRSHVLAFAHRGARNISGLARFADWVAVSHMVQATECPISQEALSWGQILANRITGVALSGLGDAPGPGAKSRDFDWIVALDQRESAIGDPTDLVVVDSPRGTTRAGSEDADTARTIVVASGGTDRLVFADVEPASAERAASLTRGSALPSVDVGRRPSALALHPDGKSVFVSCYLDDTIVEVDLIRREVRRTIRLGPPPRPTLAHRGATIYFDARRSRGAWYSCESCHPGGGSDGHRFVVPDILAWRPLRVPSLRGVAETGPWSWLGRFETLEDKVESSLHHTMAADSPPTRDEVDAVIAYLKTLRFPSPALAESANGESVARGRARFDDLGCGRCHRPPTYTSRRPANPALATDVLRPTFNPPALRGIRDVPRHLHGANARSIGDVFRGTAVPEFHREAEGLSDDELRDLVAFIESL